LISFGELTDFAEDKALMKAKQGEEGGHLEDPREELKKS
jgi:hypothetical protein